MTFLLRTLYSLLLLCIIPLILVRLWMRGRRLPAYRKRWAERFGQPNFPKQNKVLWLHAVSVGEVVSTVPLVKRFLAGFPQAKVVITTMTPTGSDRVQHLFAKELQTSVFHCYVPYDHPLFIKRLLKHIKPKMFVAMETELWPNLLHTLKAQGVPILIANGRLSPRSFRSYKRLGRVMRSMLSSVNYVAAQSLADAERFIGIGMQQDKVIPIGNIKFDFEVNPSSIEMGSQIKQCLNKPVWVAASTHAGEEELILEVYKRLQDTFDLALILVPRHPDRFAQVYDLCARTGYCVSRRSEGMPSQETHIYLGDTMGEMMSFYAASDLAFVGGSLVPVGGHNLLEPAALNLPIITGTHLFNFVKIADLLKEANAVAIVDDAQALEQEVRNCLLSIEQSKEMGARAKSVIDLNRGALERLFVIMQNVWLSPKAS